MWGDGEERNRVYFKILSFWKRRIVGRFYWVWLRAGKKCFVRVFSFDLGLEGEVLEGKDLMFYV